MTAKSNDCSEELWHVKWHWQVIWRLLLAENIYEHEYVSKTESLPIKILNRLRHASVCSWRTVWGIPPVSAGMWVSVSGTFLVSALWGSASPHQWSSFSRGSQTEQTVGEGRLDCVCVCVFICVHTRRKAHRLRIFAVCYLAAACFTPTSTILSERSDFPFILCSVYRTWAEYSSLIINVLNEGRVVDVSACKHTGHTLPGPSLLIGHNIDANTWRNW